jgi:hypothetical protein
MTVMSFIAWFLRIYFVESGSAVKLGPTSGQGHCKASGHNRVKIIHIQAYAFYVGAWYRVGVILGLGSA